MEPEEFEKIRHKIKLLMQVTPANGATYPEFESAQNKINILREKLRPEKPKRKYNENNDEVKEQWDKMKDKWFSEFLMKQHINY